MQKLTALVKVFKAILEKNLESETPSHYEIINCLGTVFSQANKDLESLPTLEEKAKIFDLMKTLNPYMLSKKREILQKLEEQKGEKSIELRLALTVFDKETLAYSGFLKAAKREKINRSKKKGKVRDFL